jgi:hypothetical protein
MDYALPATDCLKSGFAKSVMSMTTRLNRFLGPCIAGWLFLTVGCKPADDVQTYSVPRETPTSKPQNLPTPDGPAASDKYRMLGAIIPAEPGYSWFVKFVGPAEVVTPNAQAFDDFVKSIRPGTGDAKLAWTIPTNWTAAPPKPARLVTLKNGAAELYLSGPIGGSLLDNVNRWRKEVGLRELKADELKETLTEIPANGGQATRIDLSGPTWSGGMAPPFAGRR